MIFEMKAICLVLLLGIQTHSSASVNAPIVASSYGQTSPASVGSPSLAINAPSEWVDNQDKSYSSRFGVANASHDVGSLELVVLPPRAKQGTLATQSQHIWSELTQGKLDVANKRGERMVRRLSSGLNAGVVLGSLNAIQLEDRRSKAMYSALFVVEADGFVTPMLFIANQVLEHTNRLQNSQIPEALRMIEALMQRVRAKDSGFATGDAPAK
jgi:hypothetical protein